MADFNCMPNEILELIFDHLDYRSRRYLTLVCRRWNAVLLSDRFVTRNVNLKIDGNRVAVLHKHQFHRSYPNVSLQLDGQSVSSEIMKGLRLLPTVVPAPSSVRLQLCHSNVACWIGICEQQFITLRNVDTFHLVDPCNAEHAGKTVPVRMDHLRTLKLDGCFTEVLKLTAPNLRDLHLTVQYEEQLDFLMQFAHQLHTLRIVFEDKPCFYFYNINFTALRHLSIDRRLKGMTKSEQNISIAFFRRLDHLQRLELKVKFIDSYVLHTVADKLTQLLELSLYVTEGTIELKHIAKLTRLEQLRIVACKINLQNVHLPALRSLTFGSEELPDVFIYVEGIEGLMNFQRLHTLTMVNVKIYPEILRLTPTYNVERMVLSHYRRLEENHLLVLLKRFPAIRWLRVSHCHGVYQREMDKVKRSLPKLAVAFDEAKSSTIWMNPCMI